MKNSKLQLIVHGDRIADRSVTLKYPGVSLTQVHKVENPNYLFLDLEINSETVPGTFSIIFDKRNSKPLKYKYELKEREQSASKFQGVTNKDLCI